MSFGFRVSGLELIGARFDCFTACHVIVCRFTGPRHGSKHGSKQSLTGYCNDIRSGCIVIRVGKASNSLP